ncbi:aromatic-ring-hydroxylating dioxygenase subunit beta [Paenarthrobacter nitroguajacolicus]|uniref:aromatic-ring-hydroxylating dioxygenase subunit beta n=1 Tax=Paenarthrobacter nitroguajacolicus TaxID=211146 RepID=UPI00285486CF|nr:aromatic-ring-hydroxylating dioxygenase subunit beta [Paenarthrobacter nitroguajacolicus]MDR6637020.1 3-phenylpropionate/cinnamic acid dioxygenase small subunit [Paenarthrobacter nitroguajacolicus]
MTESAATQVKPGAWLTGRSTYKRPLTYAGVSSSDPRVVRAIDLINYEAELLDRKNYEEWQELYAGDGIYVIPINPETEDFASHLNMVFDNDELRRARVVRLSEGYAISAVDAATTVRTVGRFIPAQVSDSEVLLRAAQVVVAYKRGTHHVWAGDVEYRVRFGTTPSEDRLVLKVVRLVDAQDVTPAAGFLL